MTSQFGVIASLFHSDVNLLNQKSRTLPILNVVDKYGRTFHLSWLGFFVAFLSWFAFPPLLHGIIQDDLKLTQTDIANSNIIGLLATFLTRITVGTLCDRYGPRYVMVGCLLAGAIPTAFIPLISNASGFMAIRFFVGILGGTFVPCQVWTSQFFDKNIVGLTNALAAGWGNAGGGITFFVMPAIVFSLMNNQGISQHWAWRISFLVCPLIMIICIAVACLIFGDDTPTGPWHTRNLHRDMKMIRTDSISTIHVSPQSNEPEPVRDATDIPKTMSEDEIPYVLSTIDILKTSASLQTLLVALPYLCSFGSELAVEGIISNFYAQTAQVADNMTWNSQTAGNWAALFGLLNIVTRPLGGYISDILYRRKGLVAKKWWLIFLGVIQGIFFIWIGFTNLKIYPLIGAMTGLAIFMDAANGAIFSLVPAIHPRFNGVVSGVTGASGNVGGILFNLAFRFEGTDYKKALWIIGFCCLGVNLLVAWIPLKCATKEEMTNV